ncbi:MAG: heat-inducible transcriptional repressor HrcA [Lachnospiraceae bacterium]|nr:heat-inducible transcriptional repressor HrcA [Lachnospiraceae bacterium]
MQMDDRKWTILQAIIKTYLETGEPVGSRTISKYPDLNLSSATIRNEMSDLEEMGYIIQPHTSAGRIPSDAGYRFYVDRMMEENDRRMEQKDKEVTEMKELMIQRQDRMEMILKQLAKFLANNTNYATMISGPQYHRTKLKFIQLSIVDENQILAVIVAEGNVVKNKMIRMEHGLDHEMMLKMNILLNSSLNGLTIEQINLATISKLKEEAGIHSELVSRVLDAVAEAISQEEDMEIYTSGATNFFKYPELSDSEKASELISTFEEKHPLANLMKEESFDQEEHGIQVYIGQETPVSAMKDCSVVTASYDLGDGMYGRIGIVGPKRMDYDKVVGVLKNLTQQLDEIFKKDN